MKCFQKYLFKKKDLQKYDIQMDNEGGVKKELFSHQLFKKCARQYQNNCVNLQPFLKKS